MYITEVEIDGFKSYAQKTKVRDFDPSFNAITGLNGSGKSNILDAICFVFGISNLNLVRATQLQDLVYKSGQAGVTKATVTITFNNDGVEKPMGYEHYSELVVTRQIIIGGRNKYIINGRNAEQKRVFDLFRSVHLNVNNPHFLIMQGRITKVLNMKPKEILSMIEEAAGTKMYESKKEQSQKTIQKKEEKMRQIDETLIEEILPKLEQFKKDRKAYQEYQLIDRDYLAMQRLLTAWRYIQGKELHRQAGRDEKESRAKIEANEERINSNNTKIEEVNKHITQLEAERDRQSGGEIQRLTTALREAEEQKATINSDVQGAIDKLKSAEKAVKQTHKSIQDDTKVITDKRKELAAKEKQYGGAEQAGMEAKEAVAKAQRRKDACAKGLTTDEQGQEASLQQQLQTARSELAKLRTADQKANNLIKHIQPQLGKKRQELANTRRSSQGDHGKLEQMRKEVENFQRQKDQLNYDQDADAQLRADRHRINGELEDLGRQERDFHNRFPQCRFEYTNPSPNFDRSKVKGLVASLIELKDRGTATALEVAAGGGLFNVIVDNEDTGKQLLSRGQLQRRVTIIPLNKIAARAVNWDTVSHAQRLVGKENCQLALNLVGYEDELQSAMEFVFGRTFVCKDMDTAKKVTFNKDIQTRSVTLAGEVFDPQGTLTGGSRSQRGGPLLHLDEMRGVTEQTEQRRNELRQIEGRLNTLERKANQWRDLERQLNGRKQQLRMLQDKLEGTDHHRLGEEIKEMEEQIDTAQREIAESREKIPPLEAKVKDLEYKIAHADEFRKKEMKEADEQLKKAQKKLESLNKDYEKSKETLDVLREDLRVQEGEIEKQKEDLEQLKADVETAKDKLDAEKKLLKNAEEAVKAADRRLTEQREALKAKNEEISNEQKKVDNLSKEVRGIQLESHELELQIEKNREQGVQSEAAVRKILQANAWIRDDEKHFGKPGTSYDFDKFTGGIQEAKDKHDDLQAKKEKLGKEVNHKAMNLLKESEEQAEVLKKKKERLESDKLQIEETIVDLDNQKRDAIKKAWRKINSDFGEIFSTLLPGTQAKLEPPQGLTVLDGLEVRVAFGDVWKESLGELSGGQRSLVALSLVLAMLKFKPAPIYILDEVDAALDLSHTQNIGNMIKQHFTQSQFIVVSLKDGMFNNANVLFKTRFVDGCSTVGRTENKAAKQRDREQRERAALEPVNTQNR